jgi:hypothetical protein
MTPYLYCYWYIFSLRFTNYGAIVELGYSVWKFRVIKFDNVLESLAVLIAWDRSLMVINCNCSCDCCIFILCRVFIVCVVLCAVFRFIVTLFCVMCVVCVLCLIVVPLPPGENPFAVKVIIIMIIMIKSMP